MIVWRFSDHVASVAKFINYFWKKYGHIYIGNFMIKAQSAPHC